MDDETAERQECLDDLIETSVIHSSEEPPTLKVRTRNLNVITELKNNSPLCELRTTAVLLQVRSRYEEQACCLWNYNTPRAAHILIEPCFGFT
jgi:hypothetical protein